MAITNTAILKAFVEGATVKSICRNYGLTDLQVEHALRVFLSPGECAVPVQMDLQEPDPQLTIKEVYGVIEV